MIRLLSLLSVYCQQTNAPVSGQIRSSQVILLLVSRSVLLGLEPLIVTYGNILAWKEISVLFTVGRPSWRVDGTAMYRGHSLCLCHMYGHTLVCLSHFDIITIITIIGNTIIIY
jgi:hypothetical protein